MGSVLQQLGDVELHKFYRLQQNECVYYSQEYGRAKTRNSSTVLLQNGKNAIIHYFISAKDQLFAVVENLHESNDPFIQFDETVMGNDILRYYRASRLC